MPKGHRAGVLNLPQHPINYAFALALKRARLQEATTSESVARSLGIGWSLYRLIESGSAVLQPDKAIGVIRAFQKTRIEFRPLCTLLVSLQILAINKSKTIDEAQRQAEDLAAVDEGLEQVVRALDPVWRKLSQISNSRSIATALEEDGLPEIVLRFLAETIQPASDDRLSVNRPWVEKLITDTPPLFLDLVSNVISELNHYPQLLTVEYVRSWEARHRGMFRGMHAVCESLDKIIGTYGDFDWSFIADVSFKGLRVISLTEKRRQEKEKAQFDSFCDLIKKEEWFKSRKNKVREDQLLQLHFVNDEAVLRDFSRLKTERETNTIYDSAWIYELIPQDAHGSESHFVAIMDDRTLPQKIGGKTYSCIACSWEQTASWVKLLKTFLSEERTDESRS